MMVSEGRIVRYSKSNQMIFYVQYEHMMEAVLD